MTASCSESKSLAAAAVITLDEHLSALLGYSDVLAEQGNDLTAREIRRSLMRAITALRALQRELVCIELVERLAAVRPPPS